MSIKAALVQSRAATSKTAPNNTADFTDSSFSGDCKARIYWGGQTTTVNTTGAHVAISLGMSDGTNQGVTSQYGVDAANPTSWHRTIDITHAWGSGSNSGSPYFVSSAVDSALSNGGRLTLDTASGVGELINALLLGGADVQGASVCGVDFTSGSVGETRTVTHNLTVGGVSTAPNLILAFDSGGHEAAIAGFGCIALGAWAAAGTVALINGHTSGGTTESGSGILSSALSFGSRAGDSNWGGTIASVTSTTFNAISDAAAGTDRVQFLCLSINNLVVATGIGTTPTSTGTTSVITGMSAPPQVVLWMPWADTQAGAAGSGSNNAMFNFGVSVNNNGTIQETCSCASTSIGGNANKHRVGSVGIRVGSTTDADLIVGHVSAFQAGGVDVTWTVVQGTGRKFGYFAFGSSASTAAITNVNTTNIVKVGDTGIAVNGSGFGASQGAGTVTITDGIVTVAQTVTGWTATAITISIVQGGLKYGSALTLTVTTNTAQVAVKTITLNPATGRAFTNLGILRPLLFDANNLPTRFYDSPTDIPNNSQIEYPTALTVSTDGTVVWPKATTNATHRYNTPGSGVWTTLASWDLRGLPPTAVGAIGTLKGAQGVAFSFDASVNVQETDADSAPLTHALQSGSLFGLSLASSGTISGTPSSNGTSACVDRITNADGTYIDVPFSVTVTAANNVTFSGPIPDLNVVVGAGVSIDPGPYFGNESAFVLNGTPPNGVTLGNAGVLSGVPTGIGIPLGQSLSYPLSYTGSNGVGSPIDSNIFNINVFNPAISTINGILVVKSPLLQNQDQIQFQGADNVLPLRALQYCPFSSGDPAGATYHFFRLHSSARILRMDVMNDANPNGSLYICGVVKAGTTKLPVVGADSVLVSSFTLDTARVQWTPLYYPSIAGHAPSIANLDKYLWQLLGFSRDPGETYEVTVTAVAPGGASGILALSCEYSQ